MPLSTVGPSFHSTSSQILRRACMHALQQSLKQMVTLQNTNAARFEKVQNLQLWPKVFSPLTIWSGSRSLSMNKSQHAYPCSITHTLFSTPMACARLGSLTLRGREASERGPPSLESSHLSQATSNRFHFSLVLMLVYATTSDTEQSSRQRRDELGTHRRSSAFGRGERNGGCIPRNRAPPPHVC